MIMGFFLAVISIENVMPMMYALVVCLTAPGNLCQLTASFQVHRAEFVTSEYAPAIGERASIIALIEVNHTEEGFFRGRIIFVSKGLIRLATPRAKFSDVVPHIVSVTCSQIKAITIRTEDKTGLAEQLAQLVKGRVKCLIHVIIKLRPECGDNAFFALRGVGVEEEEEEFHSSRHAPAFNELIIEQNSRFAKSSNGEFGDMRSVFYSVNRNSRLAHWFLRSGF